MQCRAVGRGCRACECAIELVGVEGNDDVKSEVFSSRVSGVAAAASFSPAHQHEADKSRDICSTRPELFISVFAISPNHSVDAGGSGGIIANVRKDDHKKRDEKVLQKAKNLLYRQHVKVGRPPAESLSHESGVAEFRART